MLRIAILDDYQNVALRMADWHSLGDDVSITVFDRPLPDDDAKQALAEFDVLCLMRERMTMTGDLMRALPKLRLIVYTGTHLRTLDREAARGLGITVCHTEGGESSNATPELAWGLILACARHIPSEHQRVVAGQWQSTLGTTLHGKTLGLLGLGKLGARMAGIAQAFGMKTIAWSTNLTPERAAEAGATAVTKEQLMETSDVISIHLVLGPRNKGLIGAAEFARMKPGAILVNTSRGGIIDEPAMIAALLEKRIMAGLDVFEEEPLPAGHPLALLENVVLTPHLGFVTKSNYEIFYGGTVECIAAWRAGNPVRVLD